MRVVESGSSLSTTPINDRHDQIAPYVRLGRAVIERALLDLTLMQVNGKPAKTTRASAESFLLGPNECAYWCWVGEIDHEAVVEKAREIIAERDR